LENELKDVILQTLEELEKEETPASTDGGVDKEFLLDLRERILVLFEGLQSPNINNLDKKLDLTINFLEYTLAQIDSKLSE